eukprot:TRINITY_DN2779_c0_g1_i1.p1 TRINITY_DN2779_c0_g1~~TRINITY_DN2779_c0_g1_i1.p1  ORF type:complete len:684 (-),score=140.22 TRINITY_DN2779_c0_g1_i1:276-2021(-)
MGMTVHCDEKDEVSFRLWAPHAATAAIQLFSGEQIPLNRTEHFWEIRLSSGALKKGDKYQVVLTTPDGTVLERRDPYAKETDSESCWCVLDDDQDFEWVDWQPPGFDTYVIYELHVGSFTEQGTFAAAQEKLKYIKNLGFTSVQLMPILEHTDVWGYNPRQFFALHQEFGTPDDFRNFVNTAHKVGLAVIIDVVLHHGAVDRNALWDYDGWEENHNGGIYHEGGADTEWGRGFAFWKNEVQNMLFDSCAMYINDYKVDGLRFDSVNDLPTETVQHLTYRIRETFPGRLLSAEVTPENPQAVHDYGFDSLWVHSGYFDIIQQHRALGRGHHGGGDWAEGWNLPRLRTAMALHPGFTAPTQCIKYLLGSHDQVGCKNGGAWYEDYKMIGGQHRYAVDQYGGGRDDPHAFAVARLWYLANVGAAGLLLMFMGTEFAQSGWWNVDEHHRLSWDLSEDAVGSQMQTLVQRGNNLRQEFGALRHGWANILHEDRPNGVVAFERVYDGEEKMLVVVNAGQASWQAGEYGVWVGQNAGKFEEVLSSQDKDMGGWEVHSNQGNILSEYDGKLFLNLPPSCTLIFKAVYDV